MRNSIVGSAITIKNCLFEETIGYVLHHTYRYVDDRFTQLSSFGGLAAYIPRTEIIVQNSRLDLFYILLCPCQCETSWLLHGRCNFMDFLGQLVHPSINGLGTNGGASTSQFLKAPSLLPHEYTYPEMHNYDVMA